MKKIIIFLMLTCLVIFLSYCKGNEKGNLSKKEISDNNYPFSNNVPFVEKMLSLEVNDVQNSNVSVTKKNKPVNNYPFYDSDIQKILSLRQKDIKGILIMAFNHPSVPCYMLVIGHRKEIENIIGFPIVSMKCDELVPIEEDINKIGEIYSIFTKADIDKHILCGSDARITFVTDNAAYMIMVDINREEYYEFGKGWQSKELWQYLENLFQKHKIQI